MTLSEIKPGWRWAFWYTLLLLVTVALYPRRSEIIQVNVLIPFLLIVLGASAGGSRALGLSLAVTAFCLHNFFFQPPFDQITVRSTSDWLVLISFLATSFIATELLAQARAEAREARLRTEESRRLARLGSGTLRYADARESLTVIQSMVRDTLGVPWCRIVPWSDATGLAPIDDATRAHPALDDAHLDAACRAHRPMVRAVDGAVREATIADDPDRWELANLTALALPLEVEHRVVGVLALGGAHLIDIDAEQRRFLTALADYAALALERHRLTDAAASAEVLREANRMKDLVLASVSHDLRTPLTTIKVLAQSAAQHGGDGSLPAKQIEEQVDLLTRFVGDVLDLSRLRGNAVTLDATINTADDVFGVVARRSQGIVTDRRLVAELDLDAPALLGRFDLAHTSRILGNLVENALHVTPSGGAVTLAARRVDGWLELSVADRGPGIALDLRDRVFEPFVRSDRAVTPGRAGLGLAISRQLATLQGGSLVYEERVDGGARFVLRLPGADVDEASLAGAEVPHELHGDAHRSETDLRRLPTES